MTPQHKEPPRSPEGPSCAPVWAHDEQRQRGFTSYRGLRVTLPLNHGASESEATAYFGIQKGQINAKPKRTPAPLSHTVVRCVSPDPLPASPPPPQLHPISLYSSGRTPG
ncbi:hypothetical protein NHX12_013264 [Muraenolepis orangiensis]|uniref:Uncharacterized protein n=1 Tax=Muraenolepis orangiensis TaxID=630683 RepID=A0A9Q0I4T5_9TELE|nr:hypothetical protein NHX12_013264 [Muraenolepis orangiensis]